LGYFFSFILVTVMLESPKLMHMHLSLYWFGLFALPDILA